MGGPWVTKFIRKQRIGMAKKIFNLKLHGSRSNEYLGGWKGYDPEKYGNTPELYIAELQIQFGLLRDDWE